jgi:hypothetical protein
MTKAEWLTSKGHAAMLKWLTPTVLSLAQAAYDELLPNGALDPARLAVLSDALEEAGCPAEEYCHCEDAMRISPKGAGGQVMQSFCEECGNTRKKPNPILAHLRSPDPHVRGCWAVYLILTKE